MVRRIVISAPQSGVGKTLVACAVIHGLRKRGYAVRPFKAGPDYIDPGYLEAAAGKTAYNLDSWLMKRDELLRTFVENSDSDISVIEGVMGYYDGFSGKRNLASTHHISGITDTNTILVLDASGSSRSVAATALGFARFARRSRIVGVILNKLGSSRHELLCKDALAGVGMPVLGAVPRRDTFALKSQHLGLDPRRSIKKSVLSSIADHMDMDGIITASDSAPLPGFKPPQYKRPACTIAVAMDDSFSFYYAENLESLRRAGAKLRFFSPRSPRMPACDGLYLGGGFPEIRARELARSETKRRIKRLAEDGLPLYAECGGLMYLCNTIRYGNTKHRMAGLVDADTVMTGRPVLAYTRVRAERSVITTRGTFPGHEFHYSRLENVPHDAKFAFALDPGTGIINSKDGITQHNTLAAYGHLYFGGRKFAERFVASCAKYAR